jgi:hypothetical protein
MRCASTADTDDTANTALERADRAIHVAQHNGRSRGAEHAELVASGRLSGSVHDASVELC